MVYVGYNTCVCSYLIHDLTANINQPKESNAFVEILNFYIQHFFSLIFHQKSTGEFLLIVNYFFLYFTGWTSELLQQNMLFLTKEEFMDFKIYLFVSFGKKN